MSYSNCVFVCERAGAGQPGDGGALAIPADRAIAQAEGEEGWEEESVVHGELLCIDTHDSKLQNVIPTSSATWPKFSLHDNLTFHFSQAADLQQEAKVHHDIFFFTLPENRKIISLKQDSSLILFTVSIRDDEAASTFFQANSNVL